MSESLKVDIIIPVVVERDQRRESILAYPEKMTATELRKRLTEVVLSMTRVVTEVRGSLNGKSIRSDRVRKIHWTERKGSQDA
jgi:hypothetical protein